jgi:hypothetical protein
MGPVHLSPVTWPQALRYWYSLTSLMHIVAQLRPIDLHNFQAKYQRVVSFWVPVDYPSLNELVSMPELWRIPTQFHNLYKRFTSPNPWRHGTTLPPTPALIPHPHPSPPWLSVTLPDLDLLYPPPPHSSHPPSHGLLSWPSVFEGGGGLGSGGWATPPHATSWKGDRQGWRWVWEVKLHPL